MKTIALRFAENFAPECGTRLQRYHVRANHISGQI